MYAFNYHRPGSLAEAAKLFSSTDDPVYVAGGHTLDPTLKLRLASPSDVIDLAGVSELVGIRVDAAGETRGGAKLVVGALTRHALVAASSESTRSRFWERARRTTARCVRRSSRMPARCDELACQAEITVSSSSRTLCSRPTCLTDLDAPPSSPGASLV